MPTRNGNTGGTATQQRRQQGHNRLQQFIDQDQEMVDSGKLQTTAAVEEAGSTEEILEQSKNILAEREAQRKIKLHERSPEEFKPAKKSEAAVLTTRSKRPDMRIAKHKGMYQADPGLRVDGKTPDGRFLEHRPDLLAYRLSQGNSTAGVVFEDD